MTQSPPVPISKRAWPLHENGPYTDAQKIMVSIPSGIISQLTAVGFSEDKAKQKYHRWLDCVSNNFGDDRELIGSKVWRKSWIHRAVIASDGKCYYTGHTIDWTKIGSKGITDAALAPSIDHDRDTTQLEYRLTYIRLNRSKQDMKLREWIDLAVEVKTYLKLA